MTALTLSDHALLADRMRPQLDEAFADLAMSIALDNPDRIAAAFRSITITCETIIRNADAGQVLAELASDARFDAAHPVNVVSIRRVPVVGEAVS